MPAGEERCIGDARRLDLSRHVHYLTRANLLNRVQQLSSHSSIECDLILGHVSDDDPHFKPRDVLLVFDTAVNREQHVKLSLGQSQERTIVKPSPTTLVHCGGFVIAKKLFDSRIYAFINEDAHSRIWLLAKSKTVNTCSRVIAGYSSRN